MRTIIINGQVPEALKDRFSRYVRSFRSNDPDHNRNIDLKIEHTRRVCAEILDLGRSLNLNAADLRLAEVLALFHDIGRFEQYTRYGTFLDARSEDHARLGVKVLKEHDVLKEIGKSDQAFIFRVIAYHNAPALPADESPGCIFFTKLLRDADKLDIFRVVTDYYRDKSGKRNGGIELDLPDTPRLSEEVLADIRAGRIVKMGSMRTLNDFKLLQMAWVYDVHFPLTFERIKERGYIEMIRDALPRSVQISEIYGEVRACLENHCRAGGEVSSSPSTG